MRMARLQRIHVPGGIHYVILHSNEGRRIFHDEQDCRSLSRLVDRCVRRCGARVLAFCWMPQEIHLAIQVSSVPLGRFVQPLAGQHARWLNRKTRHPGHLFTQRYWAVLLQQPEDLPLVVAHIHLVPVRAGLVEDPEAYPWSSHRTYMGVARVPWVSTGALYRMLQFAGRKRHAAYMDFMQQELARRSEQNQDGRRIPATEEDARFLARLSPRKKKQRDAVLLDRILDSVARKLSLSRQAILSQSRRRRLALARALVAWHATSNDVATLTDVAEFFGRNPSTLCVGMERYRRTRKDLFDQPFTELLEEEGARALPRTDA